jgi:hypothetical protein
MEIEELSASGVKKYISCEKQYYLHYLSNVPEPVEFEEPRHFATGNCVHDTLEEVLQNYDISPVEKDFYNILVNESSNFEKDNQDNDKVDNCLQTASRWITSFVKEIKHVEEKWSMNRDGIKYKGLADLIADVEQDGELYENTVVDWKTGSVNEEWKERIQGGMYAEMHKEIYGEYPEAIVFVYLDEETQSFHPRITDGEVFWNAKENKYWTEIEEWKGKILQSEALGEWEAKPEQSQCFFCDYKHYCRDSPIGAENVGTNEIQMGDFL